MEKEKRENRRGKGKKRDTITEEVASSSSPKKKSLCTNAKKEAWGITSGCNSL